MTLAKEKKTAGRVRTVKAARALRHECDIYHAALTRILEITMDSELINEIARDAINQGVR